MDIQEEWDRFIVDCWIADKSRMMNIMARGFQMDHGVSSEDYSNPLKLKRFPDDDHPGCMDVFQFVAKYLPKVSNWLLAHVKNHKIDPDTKEKIIQAMKPMKLPIKYAGVGRKKDGLVEFRKDHKRYVGGVKGEVISTAKMRGRHAWHVVK